MGESQIKLVTGVNQLALKLKPIEIPDFIVNAFYSQVTDILYDGTVAIPLMDDSLTFITDSTYNGNVTWKLNNQVFDGNFNPSNTNLEYKTDGTNTVECTISDKIFEKISKTVSFNFDLEESEVDSAEVDLDVGKAIPEFVIESESDFYYFENYDVRFVVKESTDSKLNVDTNYKWFVNGSEIPDETSRTLTINTLRNAYVHEKQNIVSVVAEYAGEVVSKSYNFDIYEPKLPVFNKGYPDYGWELTDSLFFKENEYLDSFCYDSSLNLYVAVHGADEFTYIQEYSFIKSTLSYSEEPVTLAKLSYEERYITRMATDGDRIYYLLSEKNYEPLFTENNVYSISALEENQTFETVNEYGLDEFDKVTSIVCREGKLYVAGEKAEGTNCTYYIIAYPVVSNNLVVAESVIISEVTDLELFEQNPKLTKSVHNPSLEPGTTNVTYKIGSIISDMAVVNGQVYALRLLFSQNSYYWTKSDGSSSFGGNYNPVYITDLICVSDAEKSFEIDSIKSTRILAVKRKELVLGENDVSETKVDIVNLEEKENYTKKLNTSVYQFDRFPMGSSINDEYVHTIKAEEKTFEPAKEVEVNP